MRCECKSLSGLLKIDFKWFMMMTGPSLIWIQKFAVQHFFTWGLKSIHKSYNIHTCFPIIARPPQRIWVQADENTVWVIMDEGCARLNSHYRLWCEPHCSGGSRISSRRGRQLPGGGRQHTDFAKFPQKLHEIEKNLDPRGGGVPRAPLDSPLHWR